METGLDWECSIFPIPFQYSYQWFNPVCGTICKCCDSKSVGKNELLLYSSSKGDE